jgi:shikimate dehydrogenase
MTCGLDGAALLAGVIGRPIKHSLSPLLHSAWISAAGLNAVYAPFDLEEPRFGGFIDSLRGGSVRGFNVTLPFKAQALAAADTADALSRKARAANLLLFDHDGTLEARNTDGSGLLYALARQASDLRITDQPVVLLGAGGAARGAAAALAEAGVKDLRIANRTFATAAQLADEVEAPARAYAWPDLPQALRDAGLVINATSAELHGASLDVPLEASLPDAVVMDMTYRPLWTPLLRRARSLGRRTVDGLEMLIGQAIPSFEALFGRPAPEGVNVRALAREALGE